MTANVENLAGPASQRTRVRIGPVSIDVVTAAEAAETIIEMAGQARRRAAIVATANAQFVHLATLQERFAAILSRAELVVADGMSVVYASRVLRRAVPERISGVDLLVHVCGRAAEAGRSVYLLGGQPGSAAETARRMLMQFPRLEIAGVECPEFGFEKDRAQSEAVMRHIRQARPDIIFVGLGAPKQEYWMEQNADLLPGTVMMGVGGSFDLLAGTVRRAPLWLQRLGLEWLFRLAIEPRRLWKRYLFGNAKFVQLIFQQLMAERETS